MNVTLVGVEQSAHRQLWTWFHLQFCTLTAKQASSSECHPRNCTCSNTEFAHVQQEQALTMIGFQKGVMNRKLVDLKFTLEKGIEGFMPKLRTVTLARESLSKNKFHCASCGKLTRNLGSFFLKHTGVMAQRTYPRDLHVIKEVSNSFTVSMEDTRLKRFCRCGESNANSLATYFDCRSKTVARCHQDHNLQQGSASAVQCP